MKNKGKQNKKDQPVHYAVLVGLGIAIVISLLSTGLIAAFVSNESLSINTSTCVLPLIQFLSSFAGCMLVCAKLRDNKVVSSGVFCVAYYTLLIGSAGLFADGISGRFWIGLIATLIGYLCAIFLNTREKTSSRVRKRRKVYG